MNPLVETVVVLAAGQGTRMRSRVPKVLHEVCGVPLLGHVLAATAGLEAGRTVIVLGHGHDEVRSIVPEDSRVVLQQEQRGTGDALLTAADELAEGPLLVLPGDTPLLTTEALRELIDTHRSSGAAATLLTMRLADPGGYGRIVRDSGAAVVRIVEDSDADPAERSIDEVNAGMYVFSGPAVVDLLRRVGSDNVQGEIYLTDLVEALVDAGERVEGCVVGDPLVTAGVNSRVELAWAQDEMRRRILERWMGEGVTFDDPASVHVDATVRLGPDSRVLPFTCLYGSTEIGSGSEIGPSSTLVDTKVGQRCRVRHSYTDGALLEEGAVVGPFAYLRPGAHLRKGSKVGTFVEVKKSTIGEGSKVPHLSYLGDAVIGAHTNIGAGNITANYDGKNKHRTIIGENVQTGSDSVFVAPVTIGNNVTIGAGSIITKDVPDGALGIARARQRNISGYSAREKANDDTEDHGR